MPRRPRPKEVRRVVGYVRVSHVGGRSGDNFISPAVQREQVERWAEYRGAQVVGWYEDIDVSGTGRQARPEFDRMLADARAGRFDAVVVPKLDRFARSLTAASEALKVLEDEAGVSLVSVAEEIDTTTPSGRLLRSIMWAMAQWQAEQIGEGSLIAHRKRRERGVSHVSRRAYGYEYVKGSGRLGAVVPQEAAAVRMAYELRDRGAGYAEIRRRLHDGGFRTAKGEPFFAQSSLGHMLRKPYYAGLIRDPHTGELLDAEHEAIVDRALWERVQRTHGKLSEEDARLRRRAAGALSGLLRCAGCGRAMHYQKVGGGPTKAAVYRCGSRTASSKCTSQASVNAARLEEYVAARCLDVMMAAAYLDRLEVHEAGAPPSTAWRAEVDELRRRAKRDTAAIDKLVDKHLVHGTLSEADFERQLRRLEERRDEALTRADRLEADHAPANAPDFAKLRDQSPTTVEEWRSVFRELVASIEVSRAVSRGGADPRAKIADRITLEWVPSVETNEQVVALADDLHPLYWTDGYGTMKSAPDWERTLRRLGRAHGFKPAFAA